MYIHHRNPWQSMPVDNVNIPDIMYNSNEGVNVNTYVFISFNETLNMEPLHKSVEA